MEPQPTTALGSGLIGMGSLKTQLLQMVLHIANGAEFQQVFFANADSKAGIGFDQDLIKAKRINTNVLHQAGLRCDLRRISPRDAMQDLDQASLQLLLIREPFSQRVSPLL